MKIRIVPIVVLVGVTLALAACAAGPNPWLEPSGTDVVVRGFWGGLWQGFISPITFIISIFTDSVSIYEVHNTGGWYDFGFVLGAGILFGGGFLGIFRSRRK